MGDIRQYEPLWGAWYIDSLIGEGSFGKVYKVRREEFGKTYYSAVKIFTIPQNEADLRQIRGEGMDDASARSYFHAFVADIIQEIDLMSEFRGNSNIVSFEDHKVIEKTGTIGWDILIRMELLTSLTDFVMEKPLSQEEIIKLGIHICRALELCALHNTIHRDIKPDNIFVSRYGEYKLGDFGIARQIERTTSGLSKKGTYTYMAPEVFRGYEYGSSVDTYSLGIVMYRFLNQNRTPFLPDFPAVIKPSDRDESLQRRMNGKPLPPIRGIDPSLSAIVLKACAFDRKARFASPTEMREALEAVAGGKSYAPVSTPILDGTGRERTNNTASVSGGSSSRAERVEDRTSATAGVFTDTPKSAPYSPYHEATSRTEGVFTNAPLPSPRAEASKPKHEKENKGISIMVLLLLFGTILFPILSFRGCGASPQASSSNVSTTGSRETSSSRPSSQIPQNDTVDFSALGEISFGCDTSYDLAGFDTMLAYALQAKFESILPDGEYIINSFAQYDKLIASLDQGKLDAALGITRTSEREEHFLFSDPYMFGEDELCIAISKDNLLAKELLTLINDTLDDFRNDGTLQILHEEAGIPYYTNQEEYEAEVAAEAEQQAEEAERQATEEAALQQSDQLSPNNSADGELFIYDKNFNYLGRTVDGKYPPNLPFSEKYYISSTPLD